MDKKEIPCGENQNTLENKVSRGGVGSEPEGAPSRVSEDEFYEIDLVDLMLTLWKRRLIILAAALSFLACAAAYVAVAPKIYESTATLAFLPVTGAGQQSRDSYLTLAAADDLLDGVVQEVSSGASGALTVGALRKGLSVSFVQPDRSRRAQIPPAMTASFRAKDPETAAKVLSAWTDLFLERSERLPTERNAAALESLEKLLKAAKEEYEAAESRLLAYEKENLAPLLEIELRTKGETYAGLLAQQDEKNTAATDERLGQIRKEYKEIDARLLDVSAQTERLRHEKEILSESCDSLSKQYQQIKAATVGAASPLKVIEKPTVPRRPASPRRTRILGLALLLGLFVGVTAALLVEMIAKRKNAAS